MHIIVNANRRVAQTCRTLTHNQLREVYVFADTDDALPCPECDATGIFLVTCLYRDDPVEVRCPLCDGTGILDADDPLFGPTQLMRAVEAEQLATQEALDAVSVPEVSP
jgi:hypothetical protein